MRRELLISFLLVVAVAVVYWPVHSYPFVSLDDHRYVVENSIVRQGLTGQGVVWAFTSITEGNWHPVTTLSHMLDCHLFGVERGSGWHHAVNVALHAANTVLLFIVLLRMTGALWQSALVAALFGLHPLHVESVAWISERKDVLSTLFFMLILLAYCRYVRQPTILRYAAVFAWLALGLMSKPMLVTAPFVLLLLDYWPLGRMRLKQLPVAEEGTNAAADAEAAAEEDQSTETTERAESPEAEGADDATEAVETSMADQAELAAAEAEQPPSDESHGRSLSYLIVEKIPLVVLAAISAVITYFVQQRSGAMDMLGQPVPLGTRLCNALFAYGQYLEKSFWPSPLSAIYAYRNHRAIDLLIIGLALGAISVAAVRLARIRPFLLVGWCWYLGTLVPVIGLVQVGVQSMADRYTYIPLIGIFIIAAWGAAEFSEDWPAQYKAIAAAVLLAACGWCTRQQVTTWSSSEALYSHAVEAERYNLVALDGLGMVYWEEGRLDEAQRQFEDILKLKSDPAVHVEGGLEPVHRELGLLLAVRHQPQQALEQLNAAIEARPQQAEPRRHKAWILATSLDAGVRNAKLAVECAKEALARSPRVAHMNGAPEYWDTLAAAEAEAGNFKEAVEAEEKALHEAQATRADDLVDGIQQRLELFREGKPYHAEAQRPQRD